MDLFVVPTIGFDLLYVFAHADVAIDAILIPDKVAWCLIPGKWHKGVPSLTCAVPVALPLTVRPQSRA
jgi:hypothetical protein